MKPDFFKNLPPEIITEIFLRLPAVSIPISKCVCKRWLHLLESDDDFVKSHFARSAPALVVLRDSGLLKVFEFEGELDLDLESYNPLTKYDFPYPRETIKSSVNGFLVLTTSNLLSVCNPITREIIKLDAPSDVTAFGFGASKISGQYKAVYIKDDRKLDCHVYTLGTGSWRRLEGYPHPYMSQFGEGAFVNGNLHWTGTTEDDSTRMISCFDLETECFSFFKPPPSPNNVQGLPLERLRSVSALSGCLWFCDEATEYENNDSGPCEVTIWIMKEYGVEESWSKEYVIPLDDDMWIVKPINVFENGDLLMSATVYGISGPLFYYSNTTKTKQRIDVFGANRVECGLFTPTLVSLKALGLGVENMISF